MQKQMSTHALCAKDIRKELKQNFPGIRFSVRSESFSMGNSVRIYWTDGPTENEVQKVVRKYQYGHFNGMEDIYEYSNSRNDIPQVKFVQTDRKMSDEIRDWIIQDHNDKFCEEAQIKDLKAWNDHLDCWNDQVIYRKFRKLSLMKEKC